jgi:anti-sigma regulatory factor (Ser/Thr protein kinase)
MLPDESVKGHESAVPVQRLGAESCAESALDHTSITLEPSLSSVAVARLFVRKAFETWGCDEAAWEATQLVSELATNAVLHAGTEFAIEVRRSGDQVRVSVSDLSPTAPTLRPYQREATSGRGLQLVAAISKRWGFSAHLGGKAVWFEIGLDEPAHGGARDGEGLGEVVSMS